MYTLMLISKWFNPILGEGVRIPPPYDFFDRSALKDSTKWGSWGM